jgi:CRISPR system Cascade subunit CasC
LSENLKETEVARRTVEGFLRAAEAAIPSGKQNSHAAHSRPSFMLAVARTEKSAGWSLVNAFERPVRPSGESGLIGESVKALDACWSDLLSFYGSDSVKATAVALRSESGLAPGDLGDSLGQAVKPNLKAWVDAILSALPAGAEA